MSKFSKTILTATTLAVFASPLQANDTKLIDFVKYNLSRNPNITLKNIEIEKRFAIPELKAWEAVQLKVNLEANGKEMTNYEVVFKQGDVIALDLINLDKRSSMKRTLQPDLTPDVFAKDHIAFGDKSGKAEHKIVVFSDPLCPFCMSYVPELFELAKQYPNKISLYYYHLPLTSIHPAAPTLIKAAMALEAKGQKGVLEKLYEGDFEERERDEAKILKAFNAYFKSNLTLKEINTPKILTHLKHDREIAGSFMVGGTPTVFVGTKRDADRTKIEALKKELAK